MEKKIKARKMWGSTTVTPTVVLFSTEDSGSVFNGSRIAPFYVLPSDAASVEAMVDQANHGIMSLSDGCSGVTSRDMARAALAAIGIKGGKSK